MVDFSEDSEKGVRLFESGSILLHMAEKTGKFIPKDPKLRTECINLFSYKLDLGLLLDNSDISINMLLKVSGMTILMQLQGK